eukprot:6214698-Pleurochrysis_carterae.AAC.3
MDNSMADCRADLQICGSSGAFDAEMVRAKYKIVEHTDVLQIYKKVCSQHDEAPVPDFMATALPPVRTPLNAPQHMPSKHHPYVISTLVHFVTSFRGIV